MTRIKQYYPQNIYYTAEYVRDVKTVCITSNCITDETLPCYDSLHCLLWISPHYELWGIECISPEIIQNILNYPMYNIPKEKSNNFIIERIYEEEKILKIFFDPSDERHFFLLFDLIKIPTRKFCFKNVIFYVCGEELIAIECIDADVKER